jgi:polyribonucleotide 5'-hydroxyl-kinase
MLSSESMAPSSALPIGGTRILSEMQPVLIDPTQSGSGLLNAVLALLAPLNPNEAERYDEENLDLNVTGFLVM